MVEFRHTMAVEQEQREREKEKAIIDDLTILQGKFFESGSRAAKLTEDNCRL